MYLALKFIHVLAVIIFVGNISVGILWRTIGERTRDPRIIAHTMKGILLADKFFTIPAVIVLLLAGFGDCRRRTFADLGNRMDSLELDACLFSPAFSSGRSFARNGRC